MKKQLTLLACILLSSMLFSQAVPMALEEWRTNSATQDFFYMNVTKTDAFGNVIVAGAAMNNGFPDILVAKYNSAGVQLWIQQFQGTAPNGVDFAAGLYVTDTHVYLTGAISNNTLVPETDLVTMKLASSTGSVVWSTTYDQAGGHDAGKNIVVDGSGDVFVTGGSYNASLNTDYVTLRYNSSGVQQWASTWDYLGFDDAAIKVAINGANLNVTGAVTTATANVYKLASIGLSQSTGSLLATNVSTAVTTTSVDVVTDLETDNSNNIIIIGSNSVIGQGTNFYVQKLAAATLATVWTYTYNGAASLNDVAKSLKIDASNNIYVTGYTTSSTLGRELTLMKLNSSGAHQWTQTSGFTGDDEGWDIIQDASVNSYVTGYRTTTAGDQNYYTAKYDGSGTKIWEIEMTGLMDDYATNITLDSLNNVIATGQSESASGTFNFTTVKYAQHEVTTPTDFDGETPSNNFMYYTNRGQLVDANQAAVPQIKYYTHNTYPSFYFQDRSQNFVFARVDTVVATADTLHRIDLDFTNSIESSKTYAMEEQENGYLNYFLAHTGSEGVTDVKGNLRLITPNLYSNIDLMCSSNQNGIKYYFIVKPGGDMRDIKMEFTGATSYSLDGTSNVLSINSSIGSFTFDKPVVYQLTAGNATVAVTSFSPTWTTDGAANKYKFNDGAYTASLTLVIEVDQGNSASPAPSSFWSTYYGGSNDDSGVDVVMDNLGSSYMVGTTISLNFPVSAGVFQLSNHYNGDVYVAKFKVNRAREWSTFYGGSKEDYGTSIQVDANNNVYFAGQTNSPDFPLPINVYQGFNSSNSYDGFIVKLNHLGSIRLAATCFGGTNSDHITSISVDKTTNDIFLCGVTSSSSGFPFPASQPAGAYFQTTYGGSTTDGFIAKFNSSFNLIWSSYLGTSSQDQMGSTTLDKNGNFIVLGFTGGSGNNSCSGVMPLCDPGGGAYISDNSGGTDLYIAKFNNNGILNWSTMYGGSSSDGGGDVVVDGQNNIWVVSTTFGTDLPLLNAVQGSNAGAHDLCVLKFNNSGVRLFADYYGGTDVEYAGGAFADGNGNCYLTGVTYSSDFPITNSANFYNYATRRGQSDGYVVGIGATYSPFWSTYLGGTCDDYGAAVALSQSGDALVLVGSSGSTNFPVFDLAGSTDYYDGSYNGGGAACFGGVVGDAFIGSFCLSCPSTIGIKEIIDEKETFQMLVFPNPSSSLVNIELSLKKKENVTLTIFNILGEEVYSQTYKGLGDKHIQIDVTNLSKGVYFVEAIAGDKKNTKILVIQ